MTINPWEPIGFVECDTCRAKPGSSDLCVGCINNRTLIDRLKRHAAALEELQRALARLHRANKPPGKPKGTVPNE